MSDSEHTEHPPHLMELVVSRLIHEIVGPIGAMSNGIELLQEFDGVADGESLTLISDSAHEANARVQFYRMAYGRAGYQLNDLAQLRGIASEFFSGLPHYSLDWPLPPIQPAIADGFGRILLLVAEISKDCLPRGGNVLVSVSGASATVTATSQEAALPDRISAILDGANVATPREAHAALARFYADAAGFRISCQAGATQIQFSVHS